MKSFTIAIVIISIMIVGSIFYTRHLDKVSHSLSEQSSIIEKHIHASEYEQATERIDEIISYVHEKKLALAATLDHTELDRIESTLAELRAFTTQKNKTDALAKTSALKLHIEHLPKNYKLKIENIL